MRHTTALLFLYFFVASGLTFGQKPGLISVDDLKFLEKMTRDVLDSSRIRPGQRLPDPFGKNNTGGTLVRPGGRDTYPSFWIRDYAMSLETGFVTREEQKHMLLLTASTQCDQTWITKGGSMVPYGAIADHVRVDDLRPIYFPGTYDYDAQGTKEFGVFPPYCDQFYFIQMAWYYLKSTSDTEILKKEVNNTRLIDRLETAFRIPPSDAVSHIVFTNDDFRGVDFGFRDAVAITGQLSYASILKYVAANQMAEMYDRLKDKSKAESYRKIASAIKTAIPRVFLNPNGMLKASTGKSSQPDVWATTFAAYLGMLEGENLTKAGSYLANAYKSGTLAYKGSVRHILTTEDFNSKTAWESSIAAKNTYQNGAYWGTPTGWVAYTIGSVDPGSAQKLVSEYISELRENDFRKGPKYSSPLECVTRENNIRGPVYLTTVSCPLVAFRRSAQAGGN